MHPSHHRVPVSRLFPLPEMLFLSVTWVTSICSSLVFSLCHPISAQSRSLEASPSQQSHRAIKHLSGDLTEVCFLHESSRLTVSSAPSTLHGSNQVSGQHLETRGSKCRLSPHQTPMTRVPHWKSPEFPGKDWADWIFRGFVICTGM